tara:strand:+ start:1227 stop:2330 length:1104 start_codon:yes stop_codon:yes gene_type:complete
MKYLTLIFLFLFNGLSLYAQTIAVTPVQEHVNYSQNSFPINNSTLTIAPNSVQIGDVSIDQPITWAKSHDGNKISFLLNRGILDLMNVDADGNQIVDQSLEVFDPTDQTLKVYSFNDGRSIIRDNVANFTFFDANGELVYSYSNSSQSVDGERESELSSDSNGRTVVIFNPVIAYGNQTGSRASIIYGEENSYEFFRDAQREIRQVNVSGDGAFITIVAANNSGSQLFLFDRFGNELYQYQTDDELLGASLTSDANFITMFSSGRVRVFNVGTGESMGSASSRSSILYAAFIPQDETVLALGGSLAGRNISNPTLTAVHLGLRQITREDINLSLSTLNQDNIRINRMGEGRYSLTGLNKTLTVQTSY